MSCLLVRGGRLFDPASNLDAVGDVLIRAGRIAGVGSAEDAGDAEVIEAAGLMVLPGLMDIHVHLREPGQEHKETVAKLSKMLEAGWRAARPPRRP